jgi:1-pyrroline-5-carboxylate dehydrogenase
MCDHDAYAHTGQKCSAQSILLMHKNWRKTDVLEKMAG